MIRIVWIALNFIIGCLIGWFVTLTVQPILGGALAMIVALCIAWLAGEALQLVAAFASILWLRHQLPAQFAR